MKKYLTKLHRGPCFNLVNDGNENPSNKWKYKYSHYGVLWRILKFMQSRGWTVGRDPEIEANYKCLTKDRWYGTFKNWEFKAERYPRGFSIKFFQNINVEHSSGGYYDTETFELAPYLMQITLKNELKRIDTFVNEIGIVEQYGTPDFKLVEDKIKHEYMTSSHYPQKDMEYNLSELDGQTGTDRYRYHDRDKKQLHVGDVKYFRHWKTGRLGRGRIYKRLNDRWFVVINDTEYTIESAYELFDPTPEDFESRRVKKHNPPKSYLDRKEKIGEATTRELLNELKRRGAA